MGEWLGRVMVGCWGVGGVCWVGCWVEWVVGLCVGWFGWVLGRVMGKNHKLQIKQIN